MKQSTHSRPVGCSHFLQECRFLLVSSLPPLKSHEEQTTIRKAHIAFGQAFPLKMDFRPPGDAPTTSTQVELISSPMEPINDMSVHHPRSEHH